MSGEVFGSFPFEGALLVVHKTEQGPGLKLRPNMLALCLGVRKDVDDIYIYIYVYIYIGRERERDI